VSRFITHIPAGWGLKSVADVYSVNDEVLSANTPADHRFKYLELESVDTQRVDYEKAISYAFAEAPGRARRPLKTGDFLFCTVRPNLLGFSKFEPFDTDETWVGSTGLAVARAKQGVDGDFFFYQLLSNIGRRQFHALVTGSNYPAISESQFKKLELLSPGHEEQLRISAALSFVDATIAATQASIAAAQKLKQALMQKLLTGKLRPDGTWRREDEFEHDPKFGRVPKGWAPRKLKTVFKLKSGKGNTTANLRPKLEGVFNVPVFGGNGITGYFDTPLVTKKTILIGRVGEYCGAVFLTPDKAWVTDNAMWAWDFMEDISLEYLTFWLQHAHLNRLAATTGQPKLTQGDIGKLVLIGPLSSVEQQSIAAAICNFDSLTESKRDKITKLLKLKTALMQNLLTGKIRIPAE